LTGPHPVFILSADNIHEIDSRLLKGINGRLSAKGQRSPGDFFKKISGGAIYLWDKTVYRIQGKKIFYKMKSP